MTPEQWAAECQRRLTISEGRNNYAYRDSLGIPTIGIGFNLQRPDAAFAIGRIGASLDKVLGGARLTDEQVNALFAYSWAPIVDQARASLAPGVFEKLSDARRFVICDLVFNMGAGSDGWGGFGETRSLIVQAQANVDSGKAEIGHQLFETAAGHLAASAWYGQVGDRAKRDVAMLRSSNWCNPTGDGSDVL